jgi:lipoprotein signal peptidase
MTTIRKQAPLLAIVILLVLADQVTKAWVTTVMNLHESIQVIPGLLASPMYATPGRPSVSWPERLDGASYLLSIAVTLLAIGLILYSLFKAGSSGILENPPGPDPVRGTGESG